MLRLSGNILWKSIDIWQSSYSKDRVCVWRTTRQKALECLLSSATTTISFKESYAITLYLNQGSIIRRAKFPSVFYSCDHLGEFSHRLYVRYIPTVTANVTLCFKIYSTFNKELPLSLKYRMSNHHCYLSSSVKTIFTSKYNLCCTTTMASRNDDSYTPLNLTITRHIYYIVI